MWACVPGGYRPGQNGVCAGRPLSRNRSRSLSSRPSQKPDAGLQLILQGLKADILRLHPSGLISVQCKFSDRVGNCSASRLEFQAGMKELGLDLRDADLRMVYEYFDHDRDGHMRVDELIRELRGPLTDNRKQWVTCAFRKIDRDGSGRATFADVTAAYHDDESHSSAMSVFASIGNRDGYISEAAFIDYYTTVGASFDKDIDFERVVQRTWGIDDSDVLSEVADTRHMENARTAGRHPPETNRGRKVFGACTRASAEPGLLPGTGMPPKGRQRPVSARAMPRSVPAGISTITEQIKKNLSGLGAYGIIELERKLRRVAADNSGFLFLSEFKAALNEMNLRVIEQDCRLLFDHFGNGNGCLNIEEFIVGLTVPLSFRRANFLRSIFRTIDSSAEGMVDIRTLMERYNAAGHARVVGIQSEEDICRDVLEDLESLSRNKGKLTEQEFIDYYTRLSPNIAMDDDFVRMLHDEWQVAGRTDHNVDRSVTPDPPCTGFNAPVGGYAKANSCHACFSSSRPPAIPVPETQVQQGHSESSRSRLGPVEGFGGLYPIVNGFGEGRPTSARARGERRACPPRVPESVRQQSSAASSVPPVSSREEEHRGRDMCAKRTSLTRALLSDFKSSVKGGNASAASAELGRVPAPSPRARSVPPLDLASVPSAPAPASAYSIRQERKDLMPAAGLPGKHNASRRCIGSWAPQR